MRATIQVLSGYVSIVCVFLLRKLFGIARPEKVITGPWLSATANNIYLAGLVGR